MSKYSIALRDIQTRINILHYSIENYNKGSRFSDEEEKKFINDYMEMYWKYQLDDDFEGLVSDGSIVYVNMLLTDDLQNSARCGKAAALLQELSQIDISLLPAAGADLFNEMFN